MTITRESADGDQDSSGQRVLVGTAGYRIDRSRTMVAGWPPPKVEHLRAQG